MSGYFSVGEDGGWEESFEWSCGTRGDTFSTSTTPHTPNSSTASVAENISVLRLHTIEYPGRRFRAASSAVHLTYRPAHTLSQSDPERN